MQSPSKKIYLGRILIIIIFVMGLLFVFFIGDKNISNSLNSFSLDHPNFHKCMEIITNYGNYFYYLTFLSFFIYGAIRKDKRSWKIGFIYIGVQLVISVLITRGLKISIGRPRPGFGNTHIPFAGKYTFESFPSGHAVDAFCSAGVLWGFLSSYILLFLSFFFSLLIGLSRIFLGVHYFLDVLVGMSLGFISGILLTHRLLKE